MRNPDFFIVGAARSGTTSLWQYLNQHPSIFMPSDLAYKEPAYFAELYGINNIEQYLSLFTDALPEQYIGEASTAYLTAPESPRKIFTDIPDAKIIIMLRNPIERAYSLYCWMAKEGYEYICTFEEALKEEKKRRHTQDFKFNNPENYYNYLYFHSGLYCEQILRYIEVFPRNQIHIILFDAFFKDSLKVTKDVYRFLGVEPSFTPQVGIHNISGSVHSIKVQFGIRKFMNSNIKFIPQRVRNSLGRILLALNTKSTQPPGMVPGTRERLQKQYKSDIIKTGEIISEDLSQWLLPFST